MTKIVVVTMLFLIIGSLFSALFYMFKSKSEDDRMVKALTLRIGLSMTLFLLLMAGYYFGFITPQSA